MPTSSPGPSPTPSPTDTIVPLHRYWQLRQAGLPAAHAYRRAAASAAPALRYRSGPHATITLLLDDRPNLAGFTAIAVAEHDENPDWFGLGAFNDTPGEGTISVHLAAEHRHEYFRPSYTLLQRRADLARLGYARGPAHELALHQVRDDAHQARHLDARYIRVEVRKAGVLLGLAGLATTVGPDEDLDMVMAEVINDHALLDEAITEARAALPALITALST